MSAMRSMPTDAGLLTLQQEALQRVRQMQQRSRLAVEGHGEASAPSNAAGGGSPPAAAAFPPNPAPRSAPAPPETPQPTPPPPAQQTGQARQNPSASQQPPNPRQQNGARPPLAGQRSQRPSGPESILSQLFGGAKQQPAARQQTQGQRASGSSAARQNGPGGLFDLIRGGLGGGGEASGLGETLRGSISSASKPLSDLLDAFSIDGDKLLILLVMWVIFNERSDNKTLLLALGYLLL